MGEVKLGLSLKFEFIPLSTLVVFFLRGLMMFSPLAPEYASGKDELKALYFAKTGEHFRVADLDAIESILFGAGVSWEAFVADVRCHSWRDRAKKFRTLNRKSNAPITAEEAAEKAYKCQHCGSAVRGVGAVPGPNGKPVPCSCASPDWIARQRARGVFGEDTPQ